MYDWSRYECLKSALKTFVLNIKLDTKRQKNFANLHLCFTFCVFKQCNQHLLKQNKNLKKLKTSQHFKDNIEIFSKTTSTKEQIIQSGNEVVASLDGVSQMRD